MNIDAYDKAAAKAHARVVQRTTGALAIAVVLLILLPVIAAQAASGALPGAVLLLGAATVWLLFRLSSLTKRSIQTVDLLVDESRRLRESEERYRTIVTATPELVMIARNGRVDYVNGNGTAMLGAESDDFILARPVASLLGAGTSAVDRGHVLAALSAGAGLPRCEVWLSRSDGTAFCAELTGVPLPSPTDRMVLLMARDISDHRRIETSLRDAKEQAELANRTKSQFLANMSHELRTPLNAIIGFSEIIADDSFGPDGLPMYTEYARDIRDSGRHLLTVINDILDYSRIDAAKTELSDDINDIGDVISASIRVVINRAESAGVQLRQSIHEGLPPVVADTLKLKQILLNVLSNAVKFTESGGSVMVSAGLAADGGVDIQVEDTGIGMSEDELALAFQPFAQVESTLNRKYEGTGLGLPITKSLTELHGGSLVIKSAPGVGTSVTVHLPSSRVFRQSPGGQRERVSGFVG
ncbi:PAS domain S-box-containing protein [Skermanella aerolata]|uniref:sensor histidine kinase n=1 Tax=Skermanella aerolata TaxID=393310 RepID=UPI003D19B0FC